MPKTLTTLSCGGKGPCCHVGYAHRHCEHCDVVISLVPQFTWPNYWPTYNPPPMWWGRTTVGTQIGNNLGVGVNPLFAMNTAANSTVPALAEHACEVIP